MPSDLDDRFGPTRQAQREAALAAARRPAIRVHLFIGILLILASGFWLLGGCFGWPLISYLEMHFRPAFLVYFGGLGVLVGGFLCLTKKWELLIIAGTFTALCIGGGILLEWLVRLYLPR